MNEKNREIQPASRLSPSELTFKLAQANVFDLNALETNRRGKLSTSQFLVSLAAVGSFIFNVAGILFLFNFVPVGFMLISHDLLRAIGYLGIAVVVIVIFWWKGKYGKSIGFDRYDIKDIRYIPLKSLLVIDLLLWRVAEYHGPVSQDKSTGIIRTRDHRDPNNPGRVDPFAEEKTINYYAYKADKNKFPVSVEAYKALPGKLQDCRLYYLPLSKIMVNMEVL